MQAGKTALDLASDDGDIKEALVRAAQERLDQAAMVDQAVNVD